MIGRIDVHAHLIPDVDDGCKTLDDSIRCARMLIDSGYTHCFCTPHIWADLHENTVQNIPRWVARVQSALDGQQVGLTLLAGGEIALRPGLMLTPPEQVVTYAMQRKHVLVDLWGAALPEHFEATIRWLQSLGLVVILAHPERMRAVQADPMLAARFSEMGVLLQGNLQCLSDAPDAPTRQTMQRFLDEGRYFMLATDLHGADTLAMRLSGLALAADLVGLATVNRLTITNPRKLLPAEMRATPDQARRP